MRKELIQLLGKKQSEVLDINRIPGFLREYLEFTTRNTDCNPGLLITAWLPHIAVNIGNRVYMLSNSTRIYPNVWSCLLGPSSISRKTTALNYAGFTIKPHESALEDLPAESYEAKTLVLSNVTLSKLLSCLSVNATRLFVHHELSAWLAEMNKHFNSGYKQTITELYDGIDKTVSNQTRTERIRKPAFSVASSTTEAWIYKNIRDNSEQLGGFLQRFIFYVVRDLDIAGIDLQTRSGEDLESLLAIYNDIFAVFRRIPGSFRIELSDEAVVTRNAVYEQHYRYWFKKNNDSLMSYFTRIFDGYFYKLCIMFTLFEVYDQLDKAIRENRCQEFFSSLRVSNETAGQALYLCEFYLNNTIPFLEIVDEQDKLSGERKLVDLLVRKYSGKAGHSALLNSSHMRKREFRDHIDSLIDREALTVDSFKASNGITAKSYILDPELLENWAS